MVRSGKNEYAGHGSMLRFQNKSYSGDENDDHMLQVFQFVARQVRLPVLFIPEQYIQHLGLVHIHGGKFYFLHLHPAGRTLFTRFLKVDSAPGTDILRPIKQEILLNQVSFTLFIKCLVIYGNLNFEVEYALTCM